MNKLSVFSLIMLLTLTAIGTIATAQSPELSLSFEFRYVDDNPAANGETDFKGETAVFSTEQRIEFLRQYAEYAKGFFNDPELDTKIVTDKEVETVLKKLKPQPLPKVRKRILLDEWKWVGSKEGQREKKIKELSKWNKVEGVRVENNSLVFSGERVEFRKDIPSQTWRFFIQWKARVPRTNARAFFCLSDDEIVAATVGFNENGHIFYLSGNEEFELEHYRADTWYEFKIEVDLADGARRYNFYVDGQLKTDYVKLQDKQIRQINAFSANGIKAETLDDIWGVGYLPAEDVKTPYSITTFIDENFETTPSIEGWNKQDYDDSKWRTVKLPKVHGGERYAGQDLYLRKTVRIGNFSQAVLNVETLDPEGEIWVNGEVVTVLNNRHPAKVDISSYLKENETNLIAVRVKHFYSKNPVLHAPLDRNIGWFAGRMSLDLIAETYVDNVFVYAKNVSNPADIQTRISIRNITGESFRGNVVVNFYRWYPEESCVPAGTGKFPVSVRPWNEEVLENVISIATPKLWSFRDTNLYKVEVILEDESGKPIDDYVVTTGIRTISQQGGTFRINGKPEMLNGAQTMGFRTP